MKKLIALALAMILCLALVACGGPDRQPAIDAFNKAKDAFNEVANTINADIEAYDPELVDAMIEMAGVLEDHKARLESDEEISQEQLDAMIEWYGTVEEWVEEYKAEYEAG